MKEVSFSSTQILVLAVHPGVQYTLNIVRCPLPVITLVRNLQRQHLGGKIVKCAASFSRRSTRIPGGVGLVIFHYFSSLTETVLRNSTLLSVINSECDSSHFNKALTRMCSRRHFYFTISEHCIMIYISFDNTYRQA